MHIVIGTSQNRGVSARGKLLELLRDRGDDVVDCGIFDSTPVVGCDRKFL